MGNQGFFEYFFGGRRNNIILCLQLYYIRDVDMKYLYLKKWRFILDGVMNMVIDSST